MSVQQMAVMSAVTEQQDQTATTEVALLGTRAPDDGLDVVDVGFGFDHRIELRFENQSIRAAEIAGRGHRHFQPESDPGSEATSQTSQEREMRGITGRRSGGIQAGRQVQPEHSCQQDETLDGKRGHLATFDPTDRLVRHADQVTQFALAEAGRDPSDADLRAEASQQVPCESPTSLQCCLARSHAPIVTMGSARVLTSSFEQTYPAMRGRVAVRWSTRWTIGPSATLTGAPRHGLAGSVVHRLDHSTAKG